MAGDWIKMRTDLADDPAVVTVSSRCKRDTCHVVGALWSLWSWADAQTTDGKADGVTAEWVDARVRIDGFAAALEAAGWLTLTEHGIEIPRFNVHNGVSGKERAQGYKRQQKSRSGHASVTVPALQKRDQRREEKRREEKKEDIQGGESETNATCPIVGALRDWCVSEGRVFRTGDEDKAARWIIEQRPGADRAPDAIPRIVAHLRSKGTPFKNTAYAVACVTSGLEDWQRTGLPPWTNAPKPETNHKPPAIKYGRNPEY